MQLPAARRLAPLTGAIPKSSSPGKINARQPCKYWFVSSSRPTPQKGDGWPGERLQALTIRTIPEDQEPFAELIERLDCQIDPLVAHQPRQN